MTIDKSEIQNPESKILRRGWRFLRRLDLAAALILVVSLLAVLGSCFPQLTPQVAADPQRLARWEEVVRARYGGLARVLAAVGLFRWFRSPLFLAPLVLFILVTLACTLQRWRHVWRRAFDRPVVCSDTVFDSAPCTAELPSPPRGGVAPVRECLERRGFRVRMAGVITASQTHLRGDRNRLSPLATLLTHMAVLLLVLGALLSSWLGWRETLTLTPGAVVGVGHGSGLALRNDGFAIERYPDGSAAGYEAAVTLFVGEGESTRGVVRLNAPLAYRGVWVCLQAYEQGAEGTSVTILAVRDPGYGLVITAGFLLLLGLTVSFYFPHVRVHARIEPDGALRLAGWADRRAWDFEREFEMLVEEIRHVAGGTS